MSRRAGAGRAQFWRTVQENGVLVVGGAAAVVFLVAFVTIGVEASRSSVLARIYGAAGLFAGNYLPVDGQGPPTRVMSALGIAALALTFVAALSAVFATTARARERLQARDAGSDLVVLGNGVAAAEMIRRRAGATQRGLLLVTDVRTSPAALAARGRAALQVADLDTLDAASLAGLGSRGGDLVVAADNDASTLELASRLSAATPSSRVVTAVLQHSGLVDELRPPEIAGTFVDALRITCPDENTAGQVCQVLEGLWQGDEELGTAGVGTVVVHGDGGELARTVARWVRRLCWARSLTLDTQGRPVAQLHPVDGDGPVEPAAGVVYRVVVGSSSGDVAARALRLARLHNRDRGRMVAVTSEDLLPSTHAGSMKVVDPRATAWQPDLVFESTATKWGRLFNTVYAVAFGGGEAWPEIASEREGQASVLAGQFLPGNLAAHGFHLVRVDGRPQAPDFELAELNSLAEAEHADWLKRRWIDHGGDGQDRPVAVEGGPFTRPWAELTDEQRQRNRTLVKSAAGSLPALLGYEVRRIAQR